MKPTLRKPTEMGKNIEKNFRIAMDNQNMLKEIDQILSEKKMSLKKKIFSLDKMEALVHTDPKLSAVYNEMAEDGREKYGYHYNETIMNIIFNDYVLNSPKYLQKYKKIKPKLKKRRDKAGIEKLKKDLMPIEKRREEKKKEKKERTDENINENERVNVKFLVHPDDNEVFAYFPEMNYDKSGKFKSAYSQVGQHSPCHPEYARESRPATPEEYADLKDELENQVGYSLNVVDESWSPNPTEPAAGKQIPNSKIVGEDMDVEVDEPNENEDCFVESDGWKLSVSCAGKFIGEFSGDDDDAWEAVRQWKEKNQYWPNTWFISDHGNVSLVDDKGNIIRETMDSGDFRGGKTTKKEKEVDESTTAAAGATGSGAGADYTYATPHAWAAKKQKPAMKRPFWYGGSVVGEGKEKKKPFETDPEKRKEFRTTKEKGGVEKKPVWPSGKKVKHSNAQPTMNDRYEYKGGESNVYDDPKFVWDGGEKVKGVKQDRNIETSTNVSKQPFWKQGKVVSENKENVSKQPFWKQGKVLKKTVAQDDNIKDKKPSDFGKKPKQPFWKDGKIIKESVDYLTNPKIFEDYLKFLFESERDEDRMLDIVSKYEEMTGGGEQTPSEEDKQEFFDTYGDFLDNYVGKHVKDYDEKVFREGDDAVEEETDVDSKSINVKKDENMNEHHLGTRAEQIAFVKSNMDIPNIGKSLERLDDSEVERIYKTLEQKMGLTETNQSMIDTAQQSMSNKAQPTGDHGAGLERGVSMNEEAKSKAQQKFMGAVRSVQKGETKPSDVSPEVRKAAEDMTKKDVKKYAGTKHDDLPEKVDEKEKKEVCEHHLDDNQDRFDYIIKANRLLYPGKEKDASWLDKYLKNRAKLTKRDYDQVLYDTYLETEEKLREAGINPKELDVDAINEELKGYSTQNKKLKKMFEDKRPGALVLRDRLGSENEKFFKKDMDKSATKEAIQAQKDLQHKDQQTEVTNPKEHSEKIEKEVVEKTKGESLKNVGDSSNKKGDEIPKRNHTRSEQSEVDVHRLGMEDWVYDNQPDERYEERMKNQMGDEMYEKRQKKMDVRAKAPMYNKDTQPIDAGNEKNQYNKYKAGWSERTPGINETVVTGRYKNKYGNNDYVDFVLKNVNEAAEPKKEWFRLDLSGLGNLYTNTVKLNEGVKDLFEAYEFYADKDKNVFVVEKTEMLNESDEKNKKKQVNEGFNKMKHLFNYDPKSYIRTDNVKKTRGF